MVPEFEDALVIVAAFHREDLVRLHTLLACYTSHLVASRRRRSARRTSRHMRRFGDTSPISCTDRGIGKL
jgi:hypothetical protein